MCKNSRFLKLFIIISIIALIFSYTSVFATDAVYVWSNQSDVVSTSSNIIETDAGTTGNFLELTCGGAVLIEQETGKVLYEHNSHEKLRPASVTNVMDTSLLLN